MVPSPKISSSSRRQRSSSSSTSIENSPVDDSDTDQRPKKNLKDRISESLAASTRTPFNQFFVKHLMIKLSADLPVGDIVVFGDSYSKPDLEEESAVDHLLKDTSICVHSLAFPSATVEDDLPRQLSRFFTCFPKKSPYNSDVPTFDPTKTIYVLYLGINDCGRTSSDELESIVEALLGAVHDLYIKAGARNFVLVDVPPIDRSPGALDSDEMQDRVETWNDLLHVLDDPLEYDFAEDDPDDEGSAIWEDDLHLTPAVHVILADRLLTSLKAEDQ
ncbi:uncharacterized protein ARMOST_05781 [Armillaria ostoyae]|uniref:SGNH hydrolase-type esterase domain-containing protein n=1 Tax=Armillaria ostoyae TaxID=47428 RepID=A0A284R159_ARMOS|nr:uncharacterized protein ARMOST_05781 [Armillaria ostoyae]